MADLDWVSSMSVGIAEFDAAHKGYITALKGIAAALAAGRADEAERLCASFLALAQDHGRRELAFLRRKRFPQIEMVAETQAATQARIENLLTAIRRDPAEAFGMIDAMRAAVVSYLLHGDINFKSFVQELADRGESIDPSETGEV